MRISCDAEYGDHAPARNAPQKNPHQSEGFLKPDRLHCELGKDVRLASAALAQDGDNRVDDDDAVMARVLRRDAAAFRMVVDANAVMLHRIAYRMLGDAVEAEDVAQEALTRLWQHAGRWQDGGSGIAAWLTRVTMNQCLDRLRRRRFASDEAIPERADETPLAPELIEAEQERARVVAAIAALPDNQRAAIVLTYYEDHPNAVAAGMLDMNVKGFESLLFRARAALKRALTGDEAGEHQ
jgi:RNA polymerase sigma factor (sigma-70 family)